ncbi:F0F1 ATP synthase subunit A [Thalassobellus sediminis]|uniref:F0F1 ATP synthase subunit A n=1 Tax=Thalassobellus sediminis TaxID=3367753 RepID=UPI0037B6866D
MRNIFSIKTICLFFFFVTAFSFAKEEESHAEAGDVKTEIKEYINHHLLDSHDFSLTSYTTETGEHKYIGFPLPVILWDGGLQVFSSSKLHHGEAVVEQGGNYYKSFHGKIYKTDASGTIHLDEHHHATNAKPLDFSITKNVFTIFVIALLMFVVFSRMAKKYKTSALPKGIGRGLEPIILYIRDDIAIPNIGKKHYMRYMPYLLTVFFFIWIINLLGLTPLGINVTNNIAVTLALALITYVLTTFTANKNYWGHIFWMPGVPTPMKIILAPIELLGTIIKPFSLMIRLYANITAGHIVLMSIIGLMFIFKNWLGSSLSFGLAFALSLLELLVAALQAYIFTMLSALYFGSAVEEHHDDH